MPATAYIIVADNEVDQVCETKADAQREARDLRDMGCKVRIVECPWDQQDQVIDKFNR